MQHNQAIDDHLVERYLLNEMTSPLREEFEEHFFDCQECAADLRATAAFLDATRAELKATAPVPAAARPATAPQSAVSRWWQSLWVPGFALGALAACLLVVAYQNIVMYPKLTKEIARLEAPEVVPALSLAGAANRGGESPSLSISGGQSFLLLVDIPTQPRFASYLCQIYSPSHELVWSVPVSPEQAKDTVSLRVPLAGRSAGQYSLVVQGVESGAEQGAGVDLGHYNFLLNFSSTGLSR